MLTAAHATAAGIKQLLALELALEEHRQAIQQQIEDRRAALDSDRSSGHETSASEPSPGSLSPTLSRARPMSRLPKASSWANGLSEISTEASRRSQEAALWREKICEEMDAEFPARPSYQRVSRGYSSPPALPPRSLALAEAPALRHLIPELCRAAFARKAAKTTVTHRRYSEYS